MGTLTDDDLRSLLGEAAGSFEVPGDGLDAVRDDAATAEVVPLHRRRWVQLPAAVAIVAVALIGSSVIGSPDGTGTTQRIPGLSLQDTGDSGKLAYQPQKGVAREAAPSVGVATGGTAGATGSVAAPQPATQGQVAAPLPDGARVVKTGEIALVVEDGEVTPTLTALRGFATGAGGVVASSTTQESGPTPSGSVTLRVPVASFEQVVAKVRGMGAEVRSATTSDKDVTAEYADLEAQLRTLTAARERFLEILSRARTIGDVLAVQQRVDEVTGRIDRLEGSRRVLAAQSDTATLAVSVAEEDDPLLTEQDRPDDGLGKAFSDAWNGFTSGVEGLIRHSGRAVLLLLCLAAAYVVLRLGWRASRRRLV